MACLGTLANIPYLCLGCSELQRASSRESLWTDLSFAQYFNTYLLLTGYSVSQRNLLPSIAYCIGIPVQFFWGYISDLTQSRLAFTLGPILWGLVPTGILCFYAKSKSLRLFAFMIDETYFVTHICAHSFLTLCTQTYNHSLRLGKRTLPW